MHDFRHELQRTCADRAGRTRAGRSRLDRDKQASGRRAAIQRHRMSEAGFLEKGR
jgi:hypothetical protein